MAGLNTSEAVELRLYFEVQSKDNLCNVPTCLNPPNNQSMKYTIFWHDDCNLNTAKSGTGRGYNHELIRTTSGNAFWGSQNVRVINGTQNRQNSKQVPATVLVVTMDQIKIKGLSKLAKCHDLPDLLFNG